MRKLAGKRQFGRPRRRWEYVIKMCLKETEGDHVDWIHLSQSRDKWLAVVNRVISLGD
jgi:hypothetical protein